MKISKSAATIGRLLGRLPGVLPAVLALAAIAPAAHAVPTTSPASNILVPATTSGVYINVVTGVTGTTSSTAGWDINPWGTGSGFLYGATGGGIVTSALSPVAALTAGTVVGSASTFATSPGAATYGSGAGQWTLNATNYFGFSFIGEDAALHYGYGTMIVGASALVRTVGRLTYESIANTPITVAAVPEASTTAMMLLGGAAVAGLGLRRRRQTA